jgi:hypothetical protein
MVIVTKIVFDFLRAELSAGGLARKLNQIVIHQTPYPDSPIVTGADQLSTILRKPHETDSCITL